MATEFIREVNICARHFHGLIDVLLGFVVVVGLFLGLIQDKVFDCCIQLQHRVIHVSLNSCSDDCKPTYIRKGKVCIILEHCASVASNTITWHQSTLVDPNFVAWSNARAYYPCLFYLAHVNLAMDENPQIQLCMF